MEASAAKTRLREDMLRLRAALLPDERREREEALCRRLCASFPRWLSAERVPEYPVLVYFPFRSEPDLMSAIEWFWQQDIPIAAPRALRNPRRLEWRIVRSARDVEPGVWGIREPKPDCPLVPEEEARLAPLILVPGVAFDENGGRLGYGGGYYDRFLGGAAMTGRSRTLAAAFDLQILQAVPTEEHDIRVGALITESRMILCR